MKGMIINMKKSLALILAAVMVLGLCGVALASPQAATAPTEKITITGLEDGDEVKLYKVLEWYDDNDTNEHGWREVAPFNKGKDIKDYYAAMNAQKAGEIAKLASGASAVDVGTASGGTFTSGNLPVGMYLALVSTTTDTVYNPMILSINFNKDNASDAESASMAATSEFSEGQAKKQPVTMTKETNTSSDDFDAYLFGANANSEDGVYVGATLPFEVNTTIPNYTGAFIAPKFQLVDTMTDGLTLDESSVTVSVGGTSITGDSSKYSIDTTSHGFTINFTSDYLWDMKSATDVKIQYKATVTTDAIYNVNRENNTVELTFSNDSTSETSYDTIDDETNHYTFSLDALIDGTYSGRDRTSELIKTGVDGSGTPVYEWNVTSESTWEEQTKLPGAKFTLSWKDKGGNVKTSEYISGPEGRITIQGLDEGTYTLQETEAPDGYIKDPNPHTIVIKAEYSVPDAKGIKELLSYTVTIDGDNISTYYVTNPGTSEVNVTSIESTTTAIVNTQGLELPSTGGIGTTIFYVAGLLMVLGASTILVARRRADEE